MPAATKPTKPTPKPAAEKKKREPVAEQELEVQEAQEAPAHEPIDIPVERDPHTQRSTRLAQEAFEHRDVEASRKQHMLAPEQHSTGASDYIKSIVFGGLDGIVTTFAIVAAAAGADESWKTVLIFGFANALADAWSMGFGEFISGSAERDHALKERAREEWEVEVDIEAERWEMEQIYIDKGFPEEDARQIVALISKDPKRFVDIMMVEELGILVDLDDKWEPLKQGAVMFVSFIIFGVFPLLAYLGQKGQGIDYIFGIACGVTGIGLMLLGSAKGYLTSSSIPITALIMLANGAVSGGMSFAIGVLVRSAITGEFSIG